MAAEDAPKPAKKKPAKKRPEAAPLEECFVMMPIGDGSPPHDSTHWRKVYRELFVPAIKKAGYRPHRADLTKQTNVIQLDVLKSVIEAPMAICDISCRNPNVLFELGVRQAFDKPVVLVAEAGTPQIFDINPLRYTSYRSGLLYSEVRQDQRTLRIAIEATKEAIGGTGVNSLVKLLSMTAAKLPEAGKADTDDLLRLVLNRLNNPVPIQMEVAQIWPSHADTSPEDELRELEKVLVTNLRGPIIALARFLHWPRLPTFRFMKYIAADRGISMSECGKLVREMLSTEAGKSVLRSAGDRFEVGRNK